MKTPALLLTVLAGAVLAGCANNAAPVRVEPTYQEAASSQFIQSSRDAVAKLTEVKSRGISTIVDPTVIGLIGTLIGYVSAKADMVIAYYFGSSSGSREQGRAAREFYTETKTIQIS